MRKKLKLALPIRHTDPTTCNYTYSIRDDMNGNPRFFSPQKMQSFKQIVEEIEKEKSESLLNKMKEDCIPFAWRKDSNSS